MIEETSAGIVLFRKNQGEVLYLLLNYPSGHWDFVKGKKEPGETNYETAIRETKEETGITDLKFIENFEKWIEYNFQYDGELVQKKVVFFLAETKTKEIIISHEHLDFKWLDYESAMKKTTFQNAKNVLSEANKILSKSL